MQLEIPDVPGTLYPFAMKQILAALLLAGCAPAPTPPPTATAPPPPSKPGQSAFETTCAVCHQAGGTGLPGTFPPLAGSEWAVGDPEVPIAIVLRGAQGPFAAAGLER